MNQSNQLGLTSVLAAVEAAGLFVSLCTIAHPLDPNTTGQDDIGQVNLTDFTADAGLTALPCMKAPLKNIAPDPNYERKTDVQIDAMAEFHILLNGYYPTIAQHDQARFWNVGGDPSTAEKLDILNAESDSQRITTRLAVRRYSI